MSGRARVPVGASERLGIFGGHHHQTLGGAGGARNAKEGLPKKCSNRSSDARGDGGIPLATHPQHQQQSSMVAGDARATPYGALSPGRRRSFATPYNGNPIAPERSEYESVSKGTPSDNSPASDNMKIDSCRSEISRSTHAGEQTWGTSSDLENMLELEHIIGYTGHFPQTVLTHPEDSSVLIKCVGALLVIASFSDPHHQHLLRGHDMEISALAVSPFGSLVATGQSGSTRRKGFPAPVFLWDYVARRALFELQGLTEGVNHLSFSPDQKFLLGCGKNRLTYVWDTDTGELVTGKQFPESATLAQWCEVKVSGRRRTYPVCLCVGKDVLALELNFDAARRQWNMSGGPMATPSSGLRRNYYCSALLSGGKFLICGTEVGDMVVYGIDAKVFRASVPVCAGGLLSICTDPSTGSVYCGAGDGALRKISGHDMVWQQEMETRLDGGVVSLSLQADGSELLAGTQEGSVYRVLLSDLSASKVSSSHKSPVLAVACGSRVDSFATCSRDGKVRVWDLCDFGVVAEALPKQRTWGNAEESACGGVSALCVCWLREEAVLTGWSDCSVGCYDAATGTLRWEISKAHRAPVTCCAVRSDSSACFFVTGSEDGSVSIWDLRTRELLLQFAEHQKGVRAVLVDVASPDLLHSVGADCTVFTYDLRKERRTVAHMMRTGAFQGVTQRMDSENELITCDANGRLLMWDCDYRDPVQVIQDPSQQRLRCVSVSISGRYLVIAGDGEVLKVLDLANNCETVACGRAHAGPVTSVQWTKDDRQLISAAEDCTLAIWNFFGTDAPPPTDR